MATLWEIGTLAFKSYKKRKEEKARLQNPIDKDLPFGLHIDGKVTIDPVCLKIANGTESLVFTPSPVKDHIIIGFSRGQLKGATCHRILLNADDGDLGEENLSYLLLVFDEGRWLARWFTSIDVVYPSTSNEWGFWLDERSGSIGLNKFETKNEIQFTRMWDPKNPQRIEPVLFQEQVFVDRYDAQKGTTSAHQCMLYGREMSEGATAFDEMILLSQVTVNTGFSHVTIDVGVDIDPHCEMSVVY